MEKDHIVKDFYKKLVEKHGYSIKSLDYRSETSQKTRFDVITQIGISNDNSLLDVGCGFGDYFNYLKQKVLYQNLLKIYFHSKHTTQDHRNLVPLVFCFGSFRCSDQGHHVR